MALKITLSKDVLFQPLGNEAMLLHLPSEKYFGLNAVGMQVWQGLQDGRTLDDIHETLLAKYAVDPHVLQRDVDALLRALEDRKLLTVEST